MILLLDQDLRAVAGGNTLILKTRLPITTVSPCCINGLITAFNTANGAPTWDDTVNNNFKHDVTPHCSMTEFSDLTALAGKVVSVELVSRGDA